MASLFAFPKQQALDNSGDPLPGAKLFFYETGTSSPKNTYQDVDLNTAHSNPVVADQYGVFPAIWLDVSASGYRVRLTDSSNVEKWTVDDVLDSDWLDVSNRMNPNNFGVYVSLVGGTANAITLTPSMQISDYAAGQSFRFVAASSNTAATTVAVSGLAAKAITKNGPAPTYGQIPLVEGDIIAGAVVTITYDGTQFQMVSMVANDWGIYTATATGGTTSPTVSVRYAIAGKVVAIYVPAVTFTSNSTSFTLTGAPAVIRPSTLDSALMLATAFTNNSTVEYGLVAARMQTSGVLQFFRNTSDTGFTNSGTKGLTMASMFVYNLNTTPP